MPIHRIRNNRRDRRGATMALVAVLLPVLLIISAYAINITYIESLNTDVQIASDAAAHAALKEYVLSDGDKAKAVTAAQAAAALNPIGEHVMPVGEGDLDVGVSNRNALNSTHSFTPAENGNAIRFVTRSLANSNNTNIKPLFPTFGTNFQFKTQREAIATQAAMDISLVVDRSGSMAYAADEVAQYPPAPAAAPAGWDFGQPVPPSARWLDLIAAVNTFKQLIEASPMEEYVALSTYNSNPATPVRLTNDYTEVMDALQAISVSFEAGGTNIGGGMMEGSAAVTDQALGRPFATKVVIVMTDGIHNYGKDPVSAAYSLYHNGITVFTITFSDEADQNKMKKVADICGGQHFHAVTAAQLADAFREIARRLPSLLTK
ncbi:vWA domain-containing protein [Crateriforma conspicua]|uniref:von Willebrand factor type A domain protein n=1 Tax=Crateriforma conspicua TaxID=2527996 RepID=A0A5C5XZ73_9PLAN|nr:vWA domain-containing protein [Crateriforma conspicua]QDV63019.1 von Willebrand factor type A domain protein [Crateriforma conspicua]TWT68194.1 von Willebrand factor type A domain protein [Crateriforma conspicua]